MHGIGACRPSPAAALKTIAQQIGDRDNGVRSAALNTIVVAYGVIGETVYKHIGQVCEQYIDLRFVKRIFQASDSLYD